VSKTKDKHVSKTKDKHVTKTKDKHVTKDIVINNFQNCTYVYSEYLFQPNLIGGKCLPKHVTKTKDKHVTKTKDKGAQIEHEQIQKTREL
jgi:hypothetical protein